jgi:hypothetical protein
VQPWQLTYHEYAKAPDATRVPRGSVLATDPRHITADWLAARSLAELQAIALAYGETYNGTKADLAARILNAKGLRDILAHETVHTLKTLSGKTLRAWLNQARAYVPGTRYGMAAALVNWRDRARSTGQHFIATHRHQAHILRAIRRGEDVPSAVIDSHPSLRLNLRLEAEAQPLFAVIAPETEEA